MKKFLVAVLTAALVPLGFVAVSPAPATAIDCNVYPSCVVGKLRVNKITKVRFGARNKFRVRITLPTAGGAIKATGTIKLTFKRKGGGYSKTFKTRVYNGQPLFYTTPKLKKPGRYKIIGTFTAQAPFADLKNAKKNFIVKERGFVG